MRPNSCPQRLGEQALSQESVFTPRALRDTRGLRPAENMLEGQQEKVPPPTHRGVVHIAIGEALGPNRHFLGTL